MKHVVEKINQFQELQTSFYMFALGQNLTLEGFYLWLVTFSRKII